MKNAINREIPDEIVEKYSLELYKGPFAKQPTGHRRGAKLTKVEPKDSKLVSSIEEVIKKSGLQDGMTISFHHHFRGGDYIVNMVVDVIANMGIKDLTIASSSLTSVHAPLIEHIKNGVITNITTSGIRGELADEISRGLMGNPVVIRSHGGRARAIEAGDIKIDVAFLGVPAADEYGNASGDVGKAICGSLGYAKIDAQYADKVAIITDNLVEYPHLPPSISQKDVDYVIQVDEIGDPSGIASGATRYTKNPRDLLIAENAKKAIINSGYFKEGFSFQTGTGGASLAVARFLRKEMIEKGITASFALGGITRPMVEMLEEGLVKNLFDVQCFDLIAANSIAKNEKHVEIDASLYANPHNKGAVVNKLDIVILSALEVDTNFNVNVITGSDGVIRGASGGHCDAAAGSKLTMIVAPLIRGRIPTVVDNVSHVITPGETVDVLVTDRGIAVNPERQDLKERFMEANLPLYDIEELRDLAANTVGISEPIEYTDQVVGLIEYRDGTIIDVINAVK